MCVQALQFKVGQLAELQEEVLATRKNMTVQRNLHKKKCKNLAVRLLHPKASSAICFSPCPQTNLKQQTEQQTEQQSTRTRRRRSQRPSNLVFCHESDSVGCPSPAPGPPVAATESSGSQTPRPGLPGFTVHGPSSLSNC